MKKLLVTGSSGFLGWNLCQLAKEKWQVYGTHFFHRIEIPGVKQLPVDLTDFQELQRLFKEIKPDAVIHTAAQSQPNYCQTHPQESRTINVTASWNLAGLCADYSIPCAFTSTDLVFDGLNAPYRETDPVSPLSLYGEQKVMAEEGIDISSNSPKAVDIYLNEPWDYVITVCDDANETCPFFPGKVNHRLHMGFQDPSRATGSEEFIINEFRRIRNEIKDRFFEFYNNYIK